MTERELFLHTLKRAMELTPEMFESRIRNWSWTHTPSGVTVTRFIHYVQIGSRYSMAPDWRLTFRESLGIRWQIRKLAWRRFKNRRIRRRQGLPSEYRDVLTGINKRGPATPF